MIFVWPTEPTPAYVPEFLKWASLGIEVHLEARLLPMLRNAYVAGLWTNNTKSANVEAMKTHCCQRMVVTSCIAHFCAL